MRCMTWVGSIGGICRLDHAKSRLGNHMPELERISIKGFKSIGDVNNLELRPINVLIGANGSGKSNFISIFSFLRELREGKLQEYVLRSGGADRVLHFGSKNTDLIEIFLSFDDAVNQYRIKLQPTSGDDLFPEEEVVYFWDKRYPRPYNEVLRPAGSEAGISSDKVQRVASYVKAHFDNWRVYHFHDTSPSSPMKKTARVADNRFLRSDGSNLASFLYLLKKKHEASYRLIKAAVQRVFPELLDFSLEPTQLDSEFIRLEWRHAKFDNFFDTSSLSDGTLRFIALATLFLQPPEYRPSVILVDEPELGLHPSAIGVLSSLIKQSSVVTQVIVSTQSPLLLDYFSPDQVIVAELKDGSTNLTRLDSTALESWLVDYSLGQLWEKNEIGGRPMSGAR